MWKINRKRERVSFLLYGIELENYYHFYKFTGFIPNTTFPVAGQF